MTITATDDIVAGNAATVVGIETVNFNIQAFVTAAGTDTTFDVNTSGITAGAINLDVDQVGTSIVNASVTGVATGTTVTATDDFSDVTVDGDDNAAVVINTAASTVTATSAGATAMASVTASTSATGAVTIDVDDTDGTAVLTASAADDLRIDATAATSVTATSAGAIAAQNAVGAAENLSAATTVNLTAVDEITATTTAATAVTLSAGFGDATTVTDSAITDTGTTLATANLSGNGSAPAFDLRGAVAVNTVNISGDQNVTVRMGLDDIDGLTGTLTVTDSSTGTSTLDIADGGGALSVDLSNAAADVITLGTANTGALTLASGASLVVDVDQAAIGVDGTDAGAATNTATITLNDGVDDPVAVDNAVDFTGALTLTDLASVTIDASVDTSASSIDAITATADNTDVTIEAGANGVTLVTAVDLGTGDLVINSTAAIAGGATAITANSLTATGSGAVTLTAIDASTLATVTTGSGNDQLTVSATGASLTLDAGAGNNTVTFANDTTADMTYTITGGVGFDTLALTDSDGAGTGAYTAGTMNLSGIDRISIEGAAAADNAAVSVANSLLDGQSYIMNENDGGIITITVALGTGEVSSDLSSLTFDNTFDATADSFVVNQTGSTANLTLTGSNMINTFTTGTGNDVLTGGDAADVFVAGAGDNTVSGGDGGDDITASGGDDTIDGGAGADTITAGDGDDVVTGGEGADEITIGTGADTIILSEDTSAADVVFVGTVLDGSADGVAAGTFSDFNTITGFEAGVDEVSAAIANFTGAVTDVAGTAATVALNDLDASNYTSVDQVVNFISDLIAGGNYNAGDAAVDLLTVTLGNDLTALYAIDDDDAVVDATEINLIGTVDTAILALDVVIA